MFEFFLIFIYRNIYKQNKNTKYGTQINILGR